MKRAGTAYLQVRRTRPYGFDLRVVKVTQKRPTVVEPDCIVVKIRLQIPDEAWSPFEPTAVVDVPADLVQHPIAVEAVDADA